MSQDTKRLTVKKKAPARPRKNSARFLENQGFAYLLDDSKTQDPLTPISPISPPSPLSNKISPSLRNGHARGARGNDRHYKPRTSSIQVETTKTQNEQLDAIKKEVEFLKSEVPHFNEIYGMTQTRWANAQNKRKNKAESEAFSLIQTLTEWIHSYGNKAVKEYDVFKESAEKEILSMVGKVEKLNNENRKLNLLVEEAENEKEEAQNELNEAQRKLVTYAKKERELNEDKESKELNSSTINDLEAELHQVSVANKTITEKYERVEKYWKMTQDENDELRNKTYAMEEEVERLKNELKQNRENMSTMNVKHDNVLKNLQMEHQMQQQQMQQEQEKLIAAQQDHRDSTQHMRMGTAVAGVIDADDEDIAGSGITDDAEDDYEGMGGIVSLENEINVYQYEDDEWLDDSESLGEYDDQDGMEVIMAEPESEPEPEPEPEAVEEYNKQIEFEAAKLSDYHDINYEDLSKGYKTNKIVFDDQKTSAFQNESIKIDVEPKKNKMNLMMSSTNMSHTPQMSSPMGAFEASSTITEYKSIQQQFEAQSSGVMSQQNELIDKRNVPKPITKRILIERGPKQEEKVIVPGKNFAERLAMFRHLDETKGGKPQILADAKVYALVNKNKDNKLKQLMGDAKNVHITKSSVPHVGDSKQRGQQINVLKVTKKKSHTLKPRLFGYMNIIRSSFITRWKATQKPRYFFVIDGLPSETNINAKEPDFAKNRQHDFLVPTLFFFQDKDEYDTFEAAVKDVPTRDVQFQKLFAKYAKGIFPLNTYAMEVNISACMKRVNLLNKRNDIKLAMSEINACGNCDDDITILLCNDKELHRFACTDAHSRNRWVKKVNRVVDKRSKRLRNINKGLLNVYDENGNRRLAPNDIDTMTPIGGISPGSDMFSPNSPYQAAVVDSDNIINRKSRGSVLKHKKIKTVEANFD